MARPPNAATGWRAREWSHFWNFKRIWNGTQPLKMAPGSCFCEVEEAHFWLNLKLRTRAIFNGHIFGWNCLSVGLQMASKNWLKCRPHCKVAYFDHRGGGINMSTRTGPSTLLTICMRLDRWHGLTPDLKLKRVPTIVLGWVKFRVKSLKFISIRKLSDLDQTTSSWDRVLFSALTHWSESDTFRFSMQIFWCNLLLHTN